MKVRALDTFYPFITKDKQYFVRDIRKYAKFTKRPDEYEIISDDGYRLYVRSSNFKISEGE